MSTNSLKEVFHAAPPARGQVARSRQRLPRYPGIAPDVVAAVLDDLCVFVVGCGAIGRLVAINLARLFPKEITLVDRDRYYPENLETQAHHSNEIGAWKAEAVARIVSEISPGTRVRYYNGEVQSLLASPALAELSAVDAVLAFGDNLKMTADVGEFCTKFGIRLIHAALEGATMVSQVRTYTNDSAEAPCPGCQFNREEWDHHDRETVFSCDGTPSGAAPSGQEPPPTMSGPETCSMAASLAVTQFLRVLLGLGQPVGDTMLEFCGFTGRSVTNSLSRSPSCRRPHLRYDLREAPRPLAACSLDDLLGEPGAPPVNDDALFAISGWEWASKGRCTCDHKGFQPIDRFIPAGDRKGGACVACGGELDLRFDHHYPEISPPLLESLRHRPLREAGADPVDWVLRSHGATRTFFRNPSHSHE